MGQCVPATRSAGDRSRSSPAAASAVPGSPPSRKTERPARAAAAGTLHMRSEPGDPAGQRRAGDAAGPDERDPVGQDHQRVVDQLAVRRAAVVLAQDVDVLG
jgi:hypothetical protein